MNKLLLGLAPILAGATAGYVLSSIDVGFGTFALFAIVAYPALAGMWFSRGQL